MAVHYNDVCVFARLYAAYLIFHTEHLRCRDGDGFQSDSSSSNDGCVETIVCKKKEDEVPDDDSWSSEFGECIDGALFR